MPARVGSTKFGIVAFLSCLVWLAGQRSVEADARRWTLGGPEGTAVKALAIDPVKPSTLYASTLVGLSRSIDGGRRWKHIFDNPHVNVVAIDPITPTTVYVGAGLPPFSYRDVTGGMFKSSDGGMTWRAINTGLPVANDGSSMVSSLAIDPLTPSTLYAVVIGWLVKSTDRGESWRKVIEGLNPTTLAIDPRAPTTLYAGTSSSRAWTGVRVGAGPV